MDWEEFKTELMAWITEFHAIVEDGSDDQGLAIYYEEKARFLRCMGFKQFFHAADLSSWDLPTTLERYFKIMHPEEGLVRDDFIRMLNLGV